MKGSVAKGWGERLKGSRGKGVREGDPGVKRNGGERDKGRAEG